MIITQRAYTLIELMVVVAIILMLTAFGLPMFKKYQQVTEFSQKTEEVKGLFNSAQAMALTPENTQIYSYRINYDKNLIPLSKYLLVSCPDSACTSPTTVNTVSLLQGEAIQMPSGPPSGQGWILDCRTLLTDGKPTDCTFNSTTTPAFFTFIDTNIDPNKMATFTASNNPFRIDISTSDL
ncbi:MAG: prepilin-type N-terminal cleavage/methylation domain-containing protein [bacterium]|nr:prepilin-type N-terminal cleavage/methylation domain-containing protein [bacterium]